MWDLISVPASLCNVRLVTSSATLSSHRALLFSSLPAISDMVCCCPGTTTIILDPDFSSEEVAASLDTLHKTGNSQPLAGVLGLDGGEVDKLGGEVVEGDSSLLQDKLDSLTPSELNFEERAGELLNFNEGELFFKQFTLSDNSELAESVKRIEKEQLFMPLEHSYEKPKGDKTNMAKLGKCNSEKTIIGDPKKRENREKFYCEQCNKILVISDREKHMKKMHTAKVKRPEKQRKLVNCNVCNQTVREGWNLTRHMRSMHSVQGEVSCPKDFCDSTFESEYDMKVNTKIADQDYNDTKSAGA